MRILALVSAASAAAHMRCTLPAHAEVLTVGVTSDVIAAAEAYGPIVVLVHAGSLGGDLDDCLAALSRSESVVVGVASDRPNFTEFLRLSRFGLRAYFNSHMADTHYAQMLSMLEEGQSWFPPGMLGQALAAARTALLDESDADLLKVLTPRERQVAVDVAAGLSNKDIAERRDISDRTVKTHLTRIFRKLGVSGRLALAVLLRTGRTDVAEASAEH